MGTNRDSRNEPRRCPGCDAPVTPPRVFCKLSCRLRHEFRERERLPRLFPREMTLNSEWPAADEVRRTRRHPRTRVDTTYPGGHRGRD